MHNSTCGPKNAQPCWTCTKAEDYRRCPWAGGVPRTDWTATPVIIRQSPSNVAVKSYIITSCPGYEPDPEMLKK